MTHAVAPTPAATITSDDLNHLYCPCDPDTAVCGIDISGHAEGDFEEADCVVCADLEETNAPCARCGNRP